MSELREVLWILLVVCVVLTLIVVPTALVCSSGHQQWVDEAFDQGYEAGLEGAPPEVCPFQFSYSDRETPRSAWMRGWRKANLERKEDGPKRGTN